MSDLERQGGNPPESVIPEPTNEENKEESRDDVYLAPKLLSGMGVGLAFIAAVESIAGWDDASTATLRTAGAVAVGAACSAVAGFFFKDRN